MRTVAILLAGLLLALPASAQESAPVTVDASPSAAELLRRADDASASNPAESARLVQQVLDGFARKLVPWPPEADRYRSAAAAAEDFLRTHPAVLERWLRQEAPVAERAIAAGELVETVRSRAGTPAALQAMLALAQRSMDDGRVFDARAWIARAERHPMLDPAMRARLAAARSALDAVERAAHPMPVTRASAEQGGEWQPLWSVQLPMSWYARTSTDPDSGLLRRASPMQLADGSALATAPRIDGDAVLIADGAVVQALDRFSGSALWRTQVGSATDRASAPLADLAVAAPLHDLVVTLPGHALPEQRSGSPRIVALDRSTGQRRWELSLSSSQAPEFEDLFPHGEPVAVGDLVIVQARKSNSRLETAAWLLAIDAASGRIRWAIPLGAAGGVRLAASRPLSSPVTLADDLVAASSLGVVARLDGATGETRWLRRWSAPIREVRSTSPPWQLPSPVADERLVAWLAPDATTLVALDPADGHTLWTRPVGADSRIGPARTLLLDDRTLFAIGDDVVAIDRDNPDRIAWSLSGSLGHDVAIRGSVSIGTLADGTRALAVPTADAVLLLAPADGRPLGSWRLAGGGNTALQSGQVVACGAQSASMAMQAADGERLLRERLVLNPGDARRGLALLELGRSWKRPALVLEGATAAVQALRAAPDDAALRDELLHRLIDRGTLEATDGPATEKLLAFAGDLAQTPAQRAEVLLTQARQSIAAGRVADGGRPLRAILDGADTRTAIVRADAQRSVQAGVLALQALAASGDGSAVTRLAAMRVPVAEPPAAEIGEMQPAPRMLRGSLILEADDAIAERPRGSVLLQEPMALCLRRGPALEAAWRVPFVGAAPIVASWAPNLVVWSPAGRDDGRLISIDASDGSVRFERRGIGDLFDPIEAGSGGDAAEGSALRAVELFRAGQLLLLQRGDGQTVALRLDGSGGPAWRARPPVQSVRAADANAQAYAVIGPSGTDLEDVSAIFVGRAADGSEWFRGACPEGVGRPIWLHLVPGGLAIGGTEGAAVVDLEPGLPLRWIQREPRARNGSPVSFGGRWLVQADTQGRLTGLALDDGEIRSGFLQGSQPQSDDATTSARLVGGHWVVHRLKALTTHAPDGALDGEAVGAPLRRHDAIAIAGDTVVSAEIVQPDQMRALSHLPQFALRRLRLGQGLRQQGPPLTVQSEGLRLAGLTVVDGWVVIGGDDRSIAIPAPAAADSGR